MGARPRVPSTEPSVPISTPAAVMSAPLGGSAVSETTGTMRFRAVPRCCMREHHLLADEAALLERDAVRADRITPRAGTRRRGRNPCRLRARRARCDGRDIRPASRYRRPRHRGPSRSAASPAPDARAPAKRGSANHNGAGPSPRGAYSPLPQIAATAKSRWRPLMSTLARSLYMLKPLGEIRRLRPRRLEQKAVRARHDEEVEQDFALWRQQPGVQGALRAAGPCRW